MQVLLILSIDRLANVLVRELLVRNKNLTSLYT